MLLIYYNINELGVGSNMIFLCFELATLLFFCSKAPVQHIFVLVFGDIWSKIGKNLPIFCNFFSLCINKLE